ncbi:MAG: protein kinase [Lachnospiraceae bacterium]|nr:protein kinase [Lachnospiraceae bacterium]
MSEVFLAEDTRLHMKWTLKKIRAPKDAGNYIAASVIAEANVLRRVRHPNLPRIADLFREGDAVFLVMEYIEGITFEELLKREKFIKETKLLDLAIELSDALTVLHSMNPPVIYRDMKPSNIMIRPDGHACLIDFGTAKQISPSHMESLPLGTYGFAAPEQFTGAAEERSDIYALGKTLECALKKEHSRGLKRIVEKCTRERVSERFRSASALKAALRRRRFYRRRLMSALSLSFLIFLFLRLSLFSGPVEKSLSASPSAPYAETVDEYILTVESGNAARFAGEASEAERWYTKAILDLDPGRCEAYRALLSLYLKAGEAEEGLDRLDGFFERLGEETGKETGAEWSNLYYECALAAFYESRNYPRALDYFQRINPEIIPESGYFLSLSELLGALSVDIPALKRSLLEFQNYNETLNDPKTRIRNDLNIAEIYSTYAEELRSGSSGDDPLKIAAERCLEAKELTDRMGSDDASLMRELDMLSAIYRLLGTKNEAEKEKYYSRAIEYTEEFLEFEEVKQDEGEMRMKLGNMARMYEELKDYSHALEYYEQAENTGGEATADLLCAHLLCLSRSGASKEEIERIYKKALSVPGIRNNPSFLKWERSMKNEESQ